MERKSTVSVMVGNVPIGGDAPISVQSMTNTDTKDIEATVGQIERLTEAGCELVRVAIPDEASAAALAEIKRNISVPLVADIHFNYKLALMAIEQGVDKIRVNPGTLGGVKNFDRILHAARERGIPIRIGVNSGSLEKDVLDSYRGRVSEALVESTLKAVDYMEKQSFSNIVLSLKASSVFSTVDAYERMADRAPYPLHLGVTEAGLGRSGIIKSAIGIGSLLLKGVGDTIRVSLTGDPAAEIAVAKDILQAAGRRIFGPEIISCPTCARCKIDLAGLVSRIGPLLKDIKAPLKIAVMGCPVNGPGEAREAHLGVTGAGEEAIIFKEGTFLTKTSLQKVEEVFITELEKLVGAGFHARPI